MPNEENSPAGSFPEVRLSAAAAVKYINTNLGGVNGHPLKLDTCITDATPATSANCANQFVKDKAVAVTTGVDFGSAGSLPILSKAGIPVLGGVPTQAADLTTPGVYAFGSGTAGGAPAAMAYFANNLKVKKFSIIYLDSPPGQQAAIAFGKNVLKTLGVTDVTLVPAAATLSDYTAPVQQANSGNPGVIAVLEPGSVCSRIMSAKQSLGVTAKMFYTESCDGADVTKAGGAGANNSYFTTDVLAPTSDDPQIATYAAVMKTYAAGTDLSSFSETGYQAVMNTYALLRTLPASGMTSAALLAAVKKTTNEPNILGHPYSCNGKQIPGFTAVCNTYQRVLQYKNGKLEDVLGSWISGTKYLG
ncbi:MAG TPA: ABC transporter substrate-binding protein [Jatrophihabitantaceae bacterium]|jgi:branched-chain amino acid transport system substrate-binding protein